MTHQEFVAQAIGTPFQPYGRKIGPGGGVDCWGLVWAYYFLVHGIELPHYTAEYAGLYEEQDGIAKWRRLIRIFEEGTEDLWRRVERPETGDMALIYRQGLIIHIGLVMPQRRILHVEQGIDTCAEPRERMRIEGTYRLDRDALQRKYADAYVAE